MWLKPLPGDLSDNKNEQDKIIDVYQLVLVQLISPRLVVKPAS